MSEPEKIYVVTQGDCISSIAEKNGFFWQTIWELNPDLKNLRKDPNRLMPGDEVKIPELREVTQDCGTEAKHRFRKKGVPALFRLIVEHDGLPLKNTPYVLIVDGTSFRGDTDDTGLVEQSISPLAQEAVLRIADMEYEFALGGLDPIDEISGIQGRLQNLGFYDGEIDGELGPSTEEAIKEFQAYSNLEATGQIDDATRQALLDRQDSPHEIQESSNSEEEEDTEGEPGNYEESHDGDSPDEEEDFADDELEEIHDESDEDGGV